MSRHLPILFFLLGTIFGITAMTVARWKGPDGTYDAPLWLSAGFTLAGFAFLAAALWLVYRRLR